jgi:ATP/maltotriose-dependent transcriptional regulator MalT
MAVAQINLTWHEIRTGELAAARRRLAAGDRLAAQSGDQRLRALARANLAEVARLDGRYDEAVARGRPVLALLEEVGDPGHRRRVLGTIGLALAQSGRPVEAGEVLAELRELPGARAGLTFEEEDGACAAIEGTLALQRGDRELASEWFTVAAQAFAGKHDLRDVAESLVGVVASTDDPAARQPVLTWLDEVCREGGITLVARERKLLESRTDPH